MTAFAERVLEGLGPALLERAGPLLVPLVEGLTGPVGETDADLTPTPRGWARVFDLDTTRFPALIGLATGTRVPGGLNLEEQRDYVRSRPSWRRGTPRAMVAAVQQVLTGPRVVRLVERDDSPWRLTVRVYRAQYPSGDLEALRRVVATQKPVGIVATVLIDSGATFEHLTSSHGPTFADERTTFPTFAAAINHEPEEGTTP